MEIPFQIIFSIIMLILIVFSALYGFYVFRSIESEKRVFSAFEKLKNDLNSLCFSFPGTKREVEILINEKTIAIFFINDIENLNIDEVRKNVKEGKESSGEFICLIYKNKRPKCEKLSCNVTYKFVGYESKESFLDFFVKSFSGLNEIREIKIAEREKFFVKIV